MKYKLLTAAAMLCLAIGSIGAAKADADKVRIYINPGHGSWGPNDRPMQTIGRQPYDKNNVDTTGFFESNTNLHKGFALLDALNAAGVPFDRTKNQTNDNPYRVGAALDLSQNIVMSHVKAGPYPYTADDSKGAQAYNRPLSEIREEVEANNFDLFISIHSNAASGIANYPLYLYRGTDAENAVEGSRELAEFIWPYSFGNQHQTWSYYSATSKNVRGDVSFYGSSQDVVNNGKTYNGYLGVLLHGVPGFLVEGYFHTYNVACQRAMNDDVCRHEGHLYARGLIDYMGWKKETTGEIYGIVRDLHEKFSDKLYSPNPASDDRFKPLNGVVVTLLKGGNAVKTYTTDNEWNGAFIFTDLEPGEYTLSYAAEGYKPAFEEYTQPITVVANETNYVSAFLESETYEPPLVVYSNYPDALEGNAAYSIADEYTMKADGEEINPAAAALEGKTIRRQIVRNGYVYILAIDDKNEPYIYRINLENNSVGSISTSGLTLNGNKELKLSDIAFTADNVLVGVSYGENQYSADQVAEGDERGVLSVYKWELDDNGQPKGNPQEWFTSQNSGNYYNALTGQTIAVSGTSEEGSVMTTAMTKGSSTSLRWIEFTIVDGAVASTTFINNNVSAESNYTGNKLGMDFRLQVSPRATNQYIVDGSNTTPVEFQTAGQNVDAPLLGKVDASLVDNAANGATFFKYAGSDVMVTPVVADGKVAGVKMLNITNGLDNATEIATTNTNVEPAEAKFASAAGNVVTTTDDNGNVLTANIELYLVRDGKVSKFTTAGVDQPVVKPAYAYALAVATEGATSTFSFKSTAEAQEANIVFKKVADGEVAATLPVGAVKEGDNSVAIANADIPEGELNWEVEVVNKAVAQPTLISKVDGFAKSRGIAIDNSPKSPYFGQVYIANCTANEKYEKGIYIFDQMLNQQGEHAYGGAGYRPEHTASPYRLNVNENGVVFIANWDDKKPGVRLLDPAKLNTADPTAELPYFFTFDSLNEGNGALTNGGTYVSGSTTCAYIWGSGENTRLFTFDEDHPDGNNVILRYDIGTNMTWGAAATMNLGHCKMDNTDVQLIADENGVWASQTRYSPNNSEGCPSLIYVDMEGNILFNGGTISDVLAGTRGSGFTISGDGKKMVIVNDPAKYSVFDIVWNDKTPSLEYKYTIPTTNTVAVNQMAMDYAGNLYAMSQNALEVWSLPGNNKSVVTPANGVFSAGSGYVEETFAAEESLKVYPNPATNVLNVVAAKEITSIAIYSMTGAMVNASYDANGNTAVVSVEGLASGMYLIKVNNEETLTFVKK